jgi:hypothetical protein
MISHKYRCIFIHVPRTGGTSIEDMITGQDWWANKPSAKHLIASQAKKLYAPYWDAYFKFAFVRDPVARVVSCLTYARHFGLSAGKNNKIGFAGYHFRYGRKIVVEFDHRFYRRAEVLRKEHRAGAVYGNILDEPLDFIGRFETLAHDVALIKSRLKIRGPELPHLERSTEAPWRPDARSVEKIRALYAHDIVRFGYDVDVAAPGREPTNVQTLIPGRAF